MTSTLLPPQTIRWIETALGSGAELMNTRPQIGGTSSTLYRLEARLRGRSVELILRLFTHAEWLAEEPQVAAHEAASLQVAAQSGLPVPQLIAVDPDGAHNGVPAVLMTCLPGQVMLFPEDLDDWLTQQAAILLPLHSIDASGFQWHYAPYNDLRGLTVPVWSAKPRLWERAIEIVNSPAPPAKLCFIHRDYHPVNVLWQDGRLSGIVDWPNACLGPACIDVCWNRANLSGLYGVEAAEKFLTIYARLAGDQNYHPYWDLMVIIENLPGPPEVYDPWIEYGATGLTNSLMLKRVDAYLESVLAKYPD